MKFVDQEKCNTNKIDAKMPVGQQTEKLYGLQGPQNTAVLMDIITKLKQDLQQSRADNTKLVDQLNCLISLVKRAWSGEHSATLHLANIVGMEAPTFNTPEVNRNTPVMDKTRAVRNWERLAVKLLERNYAAIQEDIRERQMLHIQNRQLYMNDVLQDHNQEMSKFNLHKKSVTNVEDVDKQFMRCYTAKDRGVRRVRSAHRARSGYRGQLSHAAEMAERSEVKVEDLLGQQGAQGHMVGRADGATNAAINHLYKMDSGQQQKNPYRPRETFDDANRYRQNNLFDPDVIFSPGMLGPQRGDSRGRRSSVSDSQISSRTVINNRPKSAVFLTEARPERPLKYETTRPVSGSRARPGSGTSSLRNRHHSAPTKRPPHPSAINKKELHSRNGLDHNTKSETDENQTAETKTVNQSAEENFAGNHVTTDDLHDTDGAVVEKPPIKVKVKTGHPMDKFVEELRLATEMEEEFKRSALQLQKKLGLESGGFVF